jgi:SAM-dependent methyltransferase
MFEDSRPNWFASKLADGFTLKRVLELGPFEGYQTFLIDKLGASEITSVEGNNINFLKCLCLKEVYGIRAKFKHGDILAELKTPGTYDVLWASGVLYHMQDPIEFIESACRKADHIYIWTHFHDAAVIDAKADEFHKGLFRNQFNRTVEYQGRMITLHCRTYGIENYENNIPLYWEGAPKDSTYWLSLPDLHYLFQVNEFDVTDIEYIGDLDGMPVASFKASRRV